jgi:hypothetical protein
MTRSGLPLFLTLVLCLPVSAEMYLAGPERPVSIARQGLAAEGHASLAASAPNGKGDVLLVIWNDDRGGQAMRVSATGERLDAIPIALPITTNHVFWKEDQWVVTNGPEWVRIDGNGKLLDRTVRKITLPPAAQGRAHSAGAGWCGSAAVMIIEDWDRKYLYAWTFDRDMNFIAEKAIAPYATKGSAKVPPGFASDGSSAIFVYYDEQTNAINAVLFDRYGEIARHESVHSTDSILGGGAVGASGNGYAVIYPLELRKALYGGFTLDHDLRRRSMPSFGIQHDDWVIPVYNDQLTFDGTHYTFYFAVPVKEGTQLYATRIAADTRAVDGPLPAFVYSDRRYPYYFHPAGMRGVSMVLYEQPRTIAGTTYEYLKARIASTPAALGSAPEIDLPVGAFEQSGFSATSSATQSLVAWRESLSSPAELPAIFATRVDAQANVLNPQSIPLGLNACKEGWTAAASDGRDFLVTWLDVGGVRASIVRSDGTATPVSMPIVPNAPCSVTVQEGPNVSYEYASRVQTISNGSIYLASWAQWNVKQKGYDVFAVRIASNGTVLDQTPIAVATEAPAFQWATDGRDFLVMHGTRATRVGADGTVLDRTGLRLGGSGLQVWWDGASYATFVYDTDAKLYRLRRLGSDGSGAFASSETPPPAVITPNGFFNISGRTFRCDARGCSFAWVGSTSLYVSRAERKGETYEVSTAPVAGTEFVRPQYERYEGPNGCVLTGATTSLLVCSARSLDAPYNGIDRLFVRPLFSGPRTRAVRH